MVEEKENRIRAETPKRDVNALLDDVTAKYKKALSEKRIDQATIDKAHDMFEDKTTQEKLKKLENICAIAATAAGAVSVLTGFPTGYYMVIDAVPPALPETAKMILAGATSTALLLLVELGKRELTENLAVPLFKHRNFLPGWAAGAAACFAVSVYASVYGAEVFVLQNSGKAIGAQTAGLALTDSLGAYWDKEIAAAQAKASEYQKSNTVKWQGAETLQYAALKPLAALDAEVLELKQEKRKALAAQAGKTDASVSNAKTETIGASKKMMLFSGFNETLCALALAFQFYFFSAVYKETLFLKEEEKDPKAGEKKNGANGEPVGDPLPDEQDNLTNNPTMKASWKNENV